MTRLAAEKLRFSGEHPHEGDLNSLNASASAAILLYEACVSDELRSLERNTVSKDVEKTEYGTGTWDTPPSDEDYT